jgi:hypothetical protein
VYLLTSTQIHHWRTVLDCVIESVKDQSDPTTEEGGSRINAEVVEACDVGMVEAYLHVDSCITVT